MSDKPKAGLSERDKPFILALSSVGLFVGEIVAVVYCYKENLPDAVSTLKEALTFTMGLLSTAWTYYLVKKNGQAKPVE